MRNDELKQLAFNSSFRIHRSSFLLVASGDEEVAAEALACVEPRARALEAGRGGERGKLREVVLVRVLGVDALARAEMYVEVERVDSDGLRARAFQMHLDPALALVVERDVAEGAHMEVGLKLAVDARQKVQVEGGGDAERIVVGGFEDGGVFLQVRADEQPVARAEHTAHAAQEVARLPAVEVADVGAEEEDEGADGVVQVLAEARERRVVVARVSRDRKRRVVLQKRVRALFERGRRDVNGDVKQSPLPTKKRLDDAARLRGAAAAQLEERDRGALRGGPGDLVRAAGEDFAFGARQVVFG